ncbi:MAG: hypothetical protein EOM20_13625 [Spartobacteria bacterium]|nr:hypothetical protein [Spartobacteria bacterium]
MSRHWTNRLTVALHGIIMAGVVSTASAVDYYVATNGNDMATGQSTSFPWRTLRHAVNQVRGGDTVYVRGGTYRERVICTNTSASAGNRILITAYSNEVPEIKGSDIVDGWEAHAGAIWKREAWPMNSQQVFANGQILQQIGWPNAYTATNAFSCDDYIYIPYGYSCADIDPVLHTIDIGVGITNMVENSFYYDAAVTTLYVWLQGDASPLDAAMEVSTRVCIFEARAEADFIDLKGFTLKHSSSVTYTEFGWAAVVMGEHSTIEDCTVEWCDGSGLRIRSNGQALRCRIGYNGNGGIASFVATNLLYSECSVYSNNYRDFDLFYAFALKFQDGATGVIESNEVVGNASPGIWVDTCRENQEVIVRNNVIHNNSPTPNRPGDPTLRFTAGIFLEASHQVYVYGNVVTNNAITGIALSCAEDCRVANNTIMATRSSATPNSGLYGIWLMDQPNIYSVSSNHVYNNIVYDNQTAYDVSLPAPNGSNVFVNYMYNNCYYRDGTNVVLQYAGAAYTTLTAWATASGQGQRSTTEDPGLCMTRLTDGSPCVNTGTNMLWMVGETDLDGHPRILYGSVDMGAFEYFDFGITSGVYVAAMDGVRVSAPALPGQRYIWQATEDLVAGTWSNISDVVTAVDPSISMTDTNHAAPWRHFRTTELQ